MRIQIQWQRLMVWVLFAAVLIAPVTVWWISEGSPIAYFTHETPPGQVHYVFSKLVGLVAFCLLWLQCMLALAHRTPVLRGFPVAPLTLHMRLGFSVVALALLHYGLVFSAVTLRTGHMAWSLLLPRFTQGYHALHVSLGLIGLWLLLMGIYAGWRTACGYTIWRKAHMIWIAVFGLVFWHAFTIGSETRYGVMRYVWLFIATSLAAAVLSRIYVSFRGRKAIGAQAAEMER